MKTENKVHTELETNVSILARRQKQIDFGKNTIGYEKYLENVPKNERHYEHPKTPPKNLKYTRRAWDGLVRNWRLKLHYWDPDNKNDDEASSTADSVSNFYSCGSMNSLYSSSQASDSRLSSLLPTKRAFISPSKVNHGNVSWPTPGKSNTEHKVPAEQETDVTILARRQKQIDFGKNTIGYEKYLEKVPKYKRHNEHPKTPPKNLKFTRRAWDGLVKNWRLKLHCWDPDCKNDEDASSTSSSYYSCRSMNSLYSSSRASDFRPFTRLPTRMAPKSLPQENHDMIYRLPQ